MSCVTMPMTLWNERHRCRAAHSWPITASHQIPSPIFHFDFSALELYILCKELSDILFNIKKLNAKQNAQHFFNQNTRLAAMNRAHHSQFRANMAASWNHGHGLFCRGAFASSTQTSFSLVKDGCVSSCHQSQPPSVEGKKASFPFKVKTQKLLILLRVYIPGAISQSYGHTQQQASWEIHSLWMVSMSPEKTSGITGGKNRYSGDGQPL